MRMNSQRCSSVHRPDRSPAWRGEADARFLAEELLVAGDSWEESQFALKTLLLGGRPCSIGRPHIQESYGQHNLYLVGFKKKKVNKVG